MATKPVFNDGDPGAEIRRKLNEMGDYFEDAAQDVDEAVQAAAEAKGYRDEAEGFAGAASGSASAASDSADAASGSASTANTKAGEAAGSANTASTKAGEALASAQAAQEAADILADPAVQEVVEHIGDIQAVNANAANIDTVAGKAADVTTVAANSTNVTTVATNITAVNTAATNMAAIEAAPGAASTASSAASTATTKAGEASASALAAAGSASTASTKASEASGHADRAEQAAEDADDILQQVLAHGNGWTPVLAMASDGERRVVQVIDWTGGQGTKPATGYLGPLGIVADIGDALDIRGAPGSGSVSSVNTVEPDGNGNVDLGISDIPGLEDALDNAGQVKTVASKGPDGSGNVALVKADVGLGDVDNVSAADLRDRSTHTGTQAASTITGLATVATSGSYNDLSNRPSIPAAQVNSDWSASSGVAQILNKPSIPSDPGGGFAGVTATQTLTNKTLGSETKEGVLGSGTSITINDAAVPWRQTTLTANRTVTVSLSVGVSRSLWVNPGTYTVTWPAGIWWGGGNAPDLPANKWSLLTFTGRPGGSTAMGALVVSEP